MDSNNPMRESGYRLRKAIGLFGLVLPGLLYLIHGNLLSSLSHYYYSSAVVLFIGILFSFGLVLISYTGYPKDDDETLSDDLLTTLAGIFIFIAVIIPVKSKGYLGQVFDKNSDYLFGHESDIKNMIHLASAGLFLLILGYMCYGKFTRSKINRNYRYLYKICGLTIWICLGLTIVGFIVGKIWFENDLDRYLPGYTFWLESVAVFAFAVAWLVKGRIQKDIRKIIDYFKK